MWIEEITLDGFKSFAKRTTVPGLDQQFNAITGLNGSGKSNILDSICFVLGITNMQQVRVGSLQELVYKNGQAGVTKASVSVVFNNEDKANSPIGYEQYDQITVTRQLVIGGRNKYLVNGHVAQPGRVQSMFHSVQLNVNNPHFLIMQGRITKVLNMKAAEMLGMLEEAAGTRMYETKKEAALRTLDKKQVKVDEINKVLAEDIVPALNRLRQEKREASLYNESVVAVSELHRRMSEYSWAFEQRATARSAQDVQQAKDRLAAVADERTTAEAQAKAAAVRLEELAAERERRSGGDIRRLQADVADLAKKLATRSAAWEAGRDELKGEKEALVALQAQRAELEQGGLAEKLEAASSARKEAHARHEQAKEAVEAATRELAGAQSGDGRDGSNRSLEERLADAQQQQTAAEADLKAAGVREKHAAAELARTKKAAAKQDSASAKLEQELAAATAKVEALQQELASLSFDTQVVQQQEESVAAEAEAVQRCRNAADSLASQLGGIDFQFSDPGQGFRAEWVRGTVGKLIHGCRPLGDQPTTAAMEVAAGGALYQVVVDTAEAGKALLARGRLRNRVTLVPLDKMRKEDPLPKGLRQQVERLVGGAARPALDLVDYDAAMQPAMYHAFGRTFICKDQKTAAKLVRDIRCRCVTLEGDDFNPGGTLTGGSRKSGGATLERVAAWKAAAMELESHRQALHAARQKLDELKPAAEQHARLCKELELKQHALALLAEREGNSQASQMRSAAEEAQAALEAARLDGEAAKARRVELAEATKALERDIKNIEQERGSRVRAAQAKLDAAKGEVAASKAALRGAEAALTAARAEAEAADAQAGELATAITLAEAGLQDLEAKVAELYARTDVAEAAQRAAEEQLSARRAAEAETEREERDLRAARSRAQDAGEAAAKEHRKLELELKALDKSAEEATKHLRDLEKEFKWNEVEKAAMLARPQPSKQDVDRELAAYEAKKLEVESLGKRVNRKAINMFEKAEAEQLQLSEKKRMVEADKAKIHAVIDELDEKKKEALRLTWDKVNTDFGSIFSTLLPGTSAKLEPPEGSSFLQGLEVRVAFGGVWKQSLTELSGGQRSLLALSLILAMLLFKPAPIYILDEVDAALDLSHTQNIGRMIKAHFPQSQFVVVSLKEGMFNNANVLFRTKFVDGVSTVMRTATRRSPQEQAEAAAKVANRTPAARPALRENVVF